MQQDLSPNETSGQPSTSTVSAQHLTQEAFVLIWQKHMLWNNSLEQHPY